MEFIARREKALSEMKLCKVVVSGFFTILDIKILTIKIKLKKTALCN